MSLAIIIVIIIVAFGVAFGLPTIPDISRNNGSGKNLILVSSVKLRLLKEEQNFFFVRPS